MLPAKRGLALLVVAVALAGCGGDDGPETRTRATVGADQRGVLDTIDALQTASRRGAGREICEDVFTPQLVQSIERASKTSCPAEVRTSLFRPDASISVQRGIEVKGTRATAIIREENGDVSTLHLLKQAGRWRIDRVTPGGAS